MITKKIVTFVMSIMFAIVCLCATGVFAIWVYPEKPSAVANDVGPTVSNFHFGLIYVTKISSPTGSYQSATFTKESDTNVGVNLTLNANASSSASCQVTLYNSTDASYYYDKVENVSYSNDKISYTVEGIAQKDEVPANTYKVVTLTFKFANTSNTSSRTLTANVHLKFNLDKNAIGDVVAKSAVDKFGDILNNVEIADSYSTLKTAMDNRSGGFNAASSITYIGNVSGADSGDSAVLNGLFGDDFMHMDLDGDGKEEPVTMMIKRENLDNDVTTGDSYSYTSWGQTRTVNGNEMTIYITSADLTNVSRGASVVVYAATFTKNFGENTWHLILPLTKGSADANNYEGSMWGDANSFNTDTWTSAEGNKTIEELIASL